MIDDDLTDWSNIPPERGKGPRKGSKKAAGDDGVKPKPIAAPKRSSKRAKPKARDGTIGWNEIPYGSANEVVPLPMVNTPTAAGSTSDNLSQYELAYGLPSLLGTPKQIAFARSLRHQFLQELLPNIIDAAKGLTGEDEKVLFASLAALRNNRDTRYWIEKVGPHLGNAVDYVLSLPTVVRLEAERERQQEVARLEQQKRDAEAQQELLRRAAEGREMAKIANAFAVKHGLPSVESPVLSARQASYGRRCRHYLLTATPMAELEAKLPRLREITDACLWIAAFKSGWSVTELCQRHEQARTTSSVSR